jgi:hypothetical protein
MTIEELVDNMTMYLSEGSRPSACAEADIAEADQRFSRLFGRTLPDAYKRVLRRANGAKHNGLIVWPIARHTIFRETIFEANTDLRENFDDRFLYFGQWDEELYVLDVGRQQYCAIEFVGKDVWIEFNDDVEMFEFMLKRAWG